MSAATKEYYRELLLAALHRQDEPCTADDLVEHMGVLAQTECHTRSLWSGINSSSVAGHLRALDNAGQVIKMAEGKPDPRHGREAPLWTYVAPRDPRYPIPPDPMQCREAPRQSPAPRAPQPAVYADHDRPQLLALLEHSDEVMGAVARFMSDVREINRRHRQRFVELGMSVPE